MIVLPADACPEGLVRVTICPTRVCLATTVNPWFSSFVSAFVKVRPTTAGIVTRGGVLAAEALAVGLAVGLAAGVAALDVAGERDGAAERELAGDAVPEPPGDAER